MKSLRNILSIRHARAHPKRTCIVFLGVIVSKIVQVNISLPPLLGMLIVGIVLKNVPYNFGQFGRAECTKDHKNASFVDSINDLDSVEEHGSFKRSVSLDDVTFMTRPSNDGGN